MAGENIQARERVKKQAEVREILESYGCHIEASHCGKYGGNNPHKERVERKMGKIWRVGILRLSRLGVGV